MKAGSTKAAERQWRDSLNDGPRYATIERVYKTYLWPHPIARARRRLWVKVLVKVRYFDRNGKEVFV